MSRRGAVFTQRMLQQMDQDGDGMVTKEEYIAVIEERFTKMDGNGDGVLDKSDVSEQAQRSGRPSRRGLDGEALKAMDADGDGKVAAGEWKGPERLFERIDVDKDGFVTEEEAKTAMNRSRRNQQGGRHGASQGQPGAANAQQSSRASAMVDRLFQADANGDGKIAADEFQGPEERFSRLDKDQDGFVTREEATQLSQRSRQGQRQAGGQGFLKHFDKNQDGKVTAEEFPRAELFKKLDTNSDGVIDGQEAGKLAEMRRQRGEGGNRGGRQAR